MLIIDSMDMHKIHCVDLQVSKKKKKMVYPRNNSTIGIISNVVRLSPTCFLLARDFRPFVTIFLNAVMQFFADDHRFAARTKELVRRSVHIKP